METEKISQNIYEKIEKAHQQKQGLEEALENMRITNQRLQDEIRNKSKEIEKLLDRIKVIKSAKSMAETSGGTAEVKYKINEMVREIDRCISYLNR